MDTIEQFELLLKKTPYYLTQAYEEHVLLGQRLSPIVTEYTKIHRNMWWPRAWPFTFLMGTLIILIMALAFTKLGELCITDPVTPLIGLGLIAVTTVFLLQKSNVRLRNDEERLRCLKFQMEAFIQTISALDPFREIKDHVDETHLQPLAIRCTLVCLATSVESAERTAADMRFERRFSNHTVAMAIENEMDAVRRFDTVFDLVKRLELVDPLHDKPYERGIVFLDTTKPK